MGVGRARAEVEGIRRGWGGLETIFDNILEAQMEHAAVRDEVVSALLRLLKKKQGRDDSR